VLCDGWDCFGVVAVHSRSRDAFQYDDVALADQVANLIGAIVAREKYDVRARASQRLEAVGQLAAGVAHDFNNMLTVISGYTTFARTRADIEGERQLDHVLRAADRARALTSQLLAFSRQQVLQRRPVALSEIVEAVAPMLDTTLGENITVVETGDDAIVMADPLQIENVLVNLAVNARDAMPEGGTLTIERSNVEIDAIVAHRNEVAPGSYGTVTVRDTGVGMAEDVRARVFEPFFTTKASGSGTGLGLAGVYGTIRQSGGFVAVDSAPGSGSAFTVYLPLSDVPLQAEQEDEGDDEPDAVAAARILLVEDEDIVQRVLAKQIVALGHEVKCVDRASDALDLLEVEAFDVLLSDVGLPGIDGGSLAATVRELHPQMRVILMSGYPGDHVASNPALAGVPLLQKPFQPRELQAAVADLLS
jgi:signal transduction histidine kinase/CheY-like chemotaxis protein